MDMKAGAGGQRDPRETAQYIHALARDLKQLARDAKLGFLAYLLAMVEDDAATTIRKLDENEPV